MTLKMSLTVSVNVIVGIERHEAAVIINPLERSWCILLAVKTKRKSTVKIVGAIRTVLVSEHLYS